MILYILWFLFSVLIFFVTQNASRKEQVRFAVIFLLALGLFVGLGDMLGGYDRYIYCQLFDRMADFNNAGGNPWLSTSFVFYGTEFGYGTFCALLTYLTSNRYIFILVMTMSIYIMFIRSLTQYVDNVPFAVVMFMGLWVFFTFTYLRQVMAVTIAWLSIQYIVNRDWKRFLLVWFIAFSFHNSAIVFLPSYFVPIKKFDKDKILIVMVIALIIGLSPVPRALFSAYGTWDESRVIGANYTMDIGFRWEYLVEAVFFLFVIITKYTDISEEMNVLMLNFALIFCAILLLFVRSENGGRLGWFYLIGIFCTLSNVCVKGKKMLAHGKLMIIVCFFLFFRILFAWGIVLTPYKTFLTSGHTGAEWVYRLYEYDKNYDVNKFYR